jgi:hypothetical protein
MSALKGSMMADHPEKKLYLCIKFLSILNPLININDKLGFVRYWYR